MIPQPEPEYDGDNATYELDASQYVFVGRHRLSQEVKPAANEPQSNHQTKKGIYVVRAFVATVVFTGRVLRFLVKACDRHSGSITAGSTVIIMILTGLYVIYSKAQWQEMHTSNQNNIDSLVAVQRAFLNFRGIETSKFTPMADLLVPDLKGAAHGFNFTSKWENTGGTAATGVISYFDIAEIDADRVNAFRFLPPRGTAFPITMIGPKSPTNSGTAIRPQEFYRGISDGKTVYFWGWRIYRDIFPSTPVRVTEFCTDLVGVSIQQNNGSARPNVPLKVVPEFSTIDYGFHFGDCGGRHNCADADCEDYAAVALLWETHQPRQTRAPTP